MEECTGKKIWRRNNNANKIIMDLMRELKIFSFNVVTLIQGLNFMVV
jgi:hypothetical protein